MIYLVDDDDLVADLLLVEECVHEGNEHQQLLEAFSEWDDESKFVRTPGGVVHCRRLSVSGTGRRWRWRLLLLEASVFMKSGRHVA